MRDDLDRPAGTTNRTIRMRCRCGRAIVFDDPTTPMCSACRLVCDACTCPQMRAGGPTDAAIPSAALLEPGARVERPDLEYLQGAAEQCSVYSDAKGWLAGHLLRVIAYALSLEQDAAANQRVETMKRLFQEYLGCSCEGPEEECPHALALAAQWDGPGAAS